MHKMKKIKKKTDFLWKYLHREAGSIFFRADCDMTVPTHLIGLSYRSVDRDATYDRMHLFRNPMCPLIKRAHDVSPKQKQRR